MHDTGAKASNQDRPAAKAKPRGSRLGNAVLALASLLFGLFAIEIGYRIAMGVPVFELANWRSDHTVILDSGDVPIPDPLLGWVSRPGHVSPAHNTLAHGIRRNFAETAIRPGAVLAVGDSFTEGWEVNDGETWPAYLERQTGKPVLNAGVGGYGTDQTILRAEQLLPIVKPKVLIVGFLELDILRAGHSHFGSPKPYFTLENGALRYHPPALVTARRDGGFFVAAGYAIRDVLGYFASIDFLLRRIAPDFWFGGEKREYRRAPNDPVRVTCALLERLKQRVDREGIRMILLMQYYATAIIDDEDRPADALGVLACAKTHGIPVVDQFASLRALVEKDPNALHPYYMHDGRNFTHMSAKGNAHAAQLLAKALGE